ncbi:molybdopterin molybdotransferase MoeA [Paenibacillus sp. y28]|uniref:molybdopterin molybdotransferase MoeA n=1 Tax=Paenibacillus sp. y28 TaxID=3129110 RepID=UPI0030167F30
MIHSLEIRDSATVDRAGQLLTDFMKLPSEESVPLEEAAGRVLARDLVSPFPLPPFRRAAMDGYAVRFDAVRLASPHTPVQLTVIDEIKPGSGIDLAAAAPGKNTALRIFTGAPVPDGYDTVVMQEMAMCAGGREQLRRIRLDRPCRAGQHVAESGEDVPEGEILLTQGTRIGAKETAILASFGLCEAVVYKKPKVSIIPIGDELIVPGKKLAWGQIYDANGFMLAARLKELGAAVTRHEPVRDELHSIKAAIRQAAVEADVIVTTGGVSVGDYDFAKQAALSLGGLPLFTKVLMRPGTPTSAFKLGSRPLLCLSGNPSACFAGLELLLCPAVRRASGLREYELNWREGRLSRSINKPCPYPRYIRAYVSVNEEGPWQVEPLPNDKSGNVAAFGRANALACIPAGGGGAVQGQKVRWLSLSI